MGAAGGGKKKKIEWRVGVNLPNVPVWFVFDPTDETTQGDWKQRRGPVTKPSTRGSKFPQVVVCQKGDCLGGRRVPQTAYDFGGKGLNTGGK